MGAAYFSSVTLATGVNLVNAATLALNFSSTTINGPGTITNSAGQTLALNSSIIAATSALDNQGTLNVHGTSTLNGPLTTAAGSTLHIEGNGSYSTGTLTVLNGFTNVGLIELTDITAAYGATLAVTGGTLTNAAGATITSLVGANGTRTITVPLLVNQGTVTIGGVSAAGTLNLSGTYSQGATGILNMELGPTTSLFDHFAISAPVTLGGALNVSALSTPPLGVYNIITFSGSTTSNFSSVNAPANCVPLPSLPFLGSYGLTCT